MLNTIIYSRDRSMQLELLLRSYKKFFKEWEDCTTTIVYTSTNKDFYNGYEKCKELHPEFNYILEETCESFKDITVKLLDETNLFSMFLCDDDIFKNSFSLENEQFNIFINDPEILCVCLRLAKHTTYCYPLGSDMIVPSELQDGKDIWNWKGADKDFSYIFSLEGNVYSTEVIKNLITQLEFKNPNNLEASMSVNTHFANNLPKIICYNEASKMVNICANKVQTEFLGNRAPGPEGYLEPKDLNEKFLNNEIIDLAPLVLIKNTAPQIEHPFTFISEKTLHKTAELLAYDLQKEII